MSERARGRGRGQNLPFHPRGRGRGGQGDYGGGRSGDRGGRGDRGGGGRGRGGSPAEVEVFSQGPQHPPTVDPYGMKIENETALNAKQEITKNLKALSPSHPQRPGYGTRGREVILWANYFKLVSDGNLVLYRYSIEIRSTQDGRVPTGKLAKRVVQLLLEEHLYPQGYDVASDFRSNLISKKELDNDQEEYQVTYRTEGNDDPAPNARQYNIRLQATGTLTMSELIDYLTSSRASSLFGSKEEIIQALNIVVGHHPKAASAVANVGANRHFDKNISGLDKLDLGAGLHAIRGFFVSVRAATARILVNVQVKNMAFYNNGRLDWLMTAFTSRNGPNLVNLARFLRRVSVDVTHIKRKNKAGDRVPRIKTIHGLASRDDGRNLQHPPIVPSFGAGSKEVLFFLGEPDEGVAGKEKGKGKGTPLAGPSKGKKGKKPPKAGPDQPSSQGRYISVYDFFSERHGIAVGNSNLPVVNVGSRENPSYLPAQVCEVMPGQPAKSKLSPAQTQEMIRFAVRKPHLNARSVVSSGGQLLGFDPTNPTLNAFGVTVTPQMIAVPGRTLDGPDVMYSGSRNVRPRFGSWNMQAVQFVAKTTLAKWTYLRISWQGINPPWRNVDELHANLDRFAVTLRANGVGVAQYMVGQNIIIHQGNVEAAIDDAVHKFAVSPKRPTLVFVILPQRDNAIVYNRVKHACDVKEGLLNVCAIDTKLFKANEQYFANVGLKFNLKLGGRNHDLNPSKLGIVREKRTMVVGIDVTHPAPGSSSNAPSVAGIVASVDEFLGQWPAELRIQTAREEMVLRLDEMLESRLRLWQKRNKTLPENILIYRDGVSEGQYSLVLERELPALRSACEKVYPPTDTKSGKPKMTIINVGKRHHTRFYATKKEQADRSWNPQNGTIVDRGVTEARNWDFFLQAHAAIQGTARPAHYHVMYDQIFRERKAQAPFNSAADILEDLTHNMCYTFGRATKAVSICPPAYYADLVCERARCYLSGLYDPSPLTSPAGSVAASSAGGASQVPDSNLVQIHENIRDAMFYI